MDLSMEGLTKDFFSKVVLKIIRPPQCLAAGVGGWGEWLWWWWWWWGWLCQFTYVVFWYL